MNKLLSVLIAGAFAGGAIAQTTTTTPTAPINSGTSATPDGKYGVNTCPPGLVKKDNGCLPPGQVGKQDGTSTLGNTGSTTGGTGGTTGGTAGGTSGGTMGGTTGGTAGSGSGSGGSTK